MAQLPNDDNAETKTQTNSRRVPYVRVTKAAVVLGTLLAMVFSILIVSHCNFVTTEHHVLGLFNAAQYDDDGNLIGCISIHGDEVELDGLYKNSRAFGTATALLVTAAFLLLLFVLTFRPSKLLWNTVRYMITGATMSSMFIFSVVGSSYCSRADCRLTGVGILNIFNVFLLSSISVTMHIDMPPEQPMFTIWSDDLFTMNKDTLAVEYAGSFPEFLCHEDAKRLAEAHASDCAASVDLLQMEVVDGQPRFSHGSSSIVSEQHSIQDSLITSINVQRSKCFRYMILAIITLTWALTVFSIRRCTFIMVSAKNDDSQKFGMGVFTRAVYHDEHMLGCLSYPEEAHTDFTEAFKAARVFGTVASLLMSLVLVCGVLQLFTTIAKEAVWFGIRAMVSGAVVFQSLVFLAFKSDICEDSDQIKCSIGGAGMITVINSLLLLGLAVLSCAVPPPANPLFARWRSSQPKDVQDNSVAQDHTFLERGSPMRSQLSAVQETDETDTRASDSEIEIFSRERGPEFIIVRVEFGSSEKKTIKEITHADGSKTVTTITEEISDEIDEDESTIASRDDNADDMSLHLDPDAENVKIIL